jgi:hypothetical protein
MSATELRSYRVSLVGYGVYAVWVTAEVPHSGLLGCRAALEREPRRP